VDPGDTAAFAEALVRLAADPCARSRYGRAGRDRVRERFGLARMVADYRRLCGL